MNSAAFGRFSRGTNDAFSEWTITREEFPNQPRLIHLSPAGLRAYSRIGAVSGWELASSPLQLPLSLEKLSDRRRLRLLRLLLVEELLGGRRLLRGVGRHGRRGPCVRKRHYAPARGQGRVRVVEARRSHAKVRRHGELLVEVEATQRGRELASPYLTVYHTHAHSP
jgi:hypothetical protein